MGLSGNRKALSNTGIIVIVSVILVVVLGATVAYFVFLTNNLKTEEMNFNGFTAVEVGWAFEVSIKQSSSYSVVVSADEEIFDKIEVNQFDDMLFIDLDQGTIDPTGLVRKVEIKMPDLNTLILYGASQGKVEGFSNSNQFSLDLSGASSLEMYNVNVGDALIEVSGASTLDASGTAQDLGSTVSGASNMDLSDFAVYNAEVYVVGASQAIINLDGTLDAEVSGVSKLEYIGEPTMGDINVEDVSTIKKK